MGKTEEEEEEVGNDGGDDEGGEGGGDGEEGGESLEDVVARWEATLGPKYKIIVSTSSSTQHCLCNFLKGIVHQKILSFKSHILESNGLWYS